MFILIFNAYITTDYVPIIFTEFKSIVNIECDTLIDRIRDLLLYQVN